MIFELSIMFSLYTPYSVCFRMAVIVEYALDLTWDAATRTWEPAQSRSSVSPSGQLTPSITEGLA